MIVLSVCYLCKFYGDVVVFIDVVLDLVVGEIVVLLGEFGSGKLMLLNCLVGLDEVDVGLIMLVGLDLCVLDDEVCFVLWCCELGFIF